MTRRRKGRARFLPKYVTSFEDRHGKARYRFRRKGYEDHYFKAELGSDEFRQEYAACMKAVVVSEEQQTRWAIGTIGDLVARYIAVPARLAPTEATQGKIRSILEKWRDEYGTAYVADVNFQHIDDIITEKRKKVLVGKRWEGGIEAARKLRKELVRLFDHAEKIGMIPKGANPVKHAEKVRVAAGQKSKGYYSWTEQDIDQYRARHALGSKPRLALELLLWTGQRRGDGYLFGPNDIKNGRFEITQGKTGKEMSLTIAPQLLAAIQAMPPLPADSPAFLLSELGRPFSYASFGNKMRDWFDQAGLPQCTAHGLRKANARRLAERRMGNSSIKAVGGWTNDREVSIYTAAANQAHLADLAITDLSDWETQKGRENE